MGTLFVVNNSTVEGTDNLVVSGLFTLTVSSTLGFSGTTTAQGGLATGSSAYVDGGGDVDQPGTSRTAHSPPATAATIDNQAGATGLPERRLPSVVPRHRALFTNEGTVTADAGTDADGLYLPVTNTGTITSLAGLMSWDTTAWPAARPPTSMPDPMASCLCRQLDHPR